MVLYKQIFPIDKINVTAKINTLNGKKKLGCPIKRFEHVVLCRHILWVSNNKINRYGFRVVYLCINHAQIIIDEVCCKCVLKKDTNK